MVQPTQKFSCIYLLKIIHEIVQKTYFLNYNNCSLHDELTIIQHEKRNRERKKEQKGEEMFDENSTNANRQKYNHKLHAIIGILSHTLKLRFKFVALKPKNSYPFFKIKQNKAWGGRCRWLSKLVSWRLGIASDFSSNGGRNRSRKFDKGLRYKFIIYRSNI
jgi:hypothetical protein